MSSFTRSERRVIRALHRLSRPATTNEIAMKAEMGWNTAEAVLLDLKARYIVTCKKRGKRYFWLRNF